MARLKAAAAIVVAILLAATVSYVFGHARGSVDRRELETTRLRLQLVEARAQVLDARVSLYLVNFGEAGRHLAFGKSALGAAREILAGRGDTELLPTLEQAVKAIEAAQDRASRLSPEANDRAGEAARLLNDVIQAAPR